MFICSELTFVILTKNEASRLRACLTSLAGLQCPIIIVDDCSTDSTVQLANEFGAKVFTRALDTFSNQRNYALSLVQTRYVFMVDADEVLSEELIAEIRSLEAIPRGNTAYLVPRVTHFLGRKILHSGWYPDLQLRLFQADTSKYVGAVHETVHVPGETCILKGHINHFTYTSVAQYIDKLNKYTDLEVVKRGTGSEKSKRLLNNIIVKPILRFLWMYFVKRGFMDGTEGLHLAILSSFYEVAILSKQYEKIKAEFRDNGGAS